MVNPKYACPLPFNHMAIRPDGKILPCCVFRWDDVPEDLNIDYKDPFNHPFMKNLRDKMSKDVYVEGCKECYQKEEFGNESFRKHALDKQEDYGATSLVEGTPPELTYIDLSISNTCNNKCRMCNPGLSTSWYSDAKKLGIEIPKGIIKNPFIENTDFSKLKFIKLLGGEPLMEQKVIKKILNQCDLSQLHLLVITNGTVIPDDELKGMLEQVKRLEVKLSIDAYGKLNDFLRSGSKWETVEKTVDWFKAFVNKKFLSIHSVASIYNINKLDEMVEYAKSKEIYQEYVPLDDVDYMQTKHLPLETKKLLVEQIRSKNYKFSTSLIYELEKHGDTNLFLKQDAIMNALRSEHWKEYNPELWQMINLTNKAKGVIINYE